MDSEDPSLRRLGPLGRLQGTDIYLIDQLLKERIPRGARILDVGAGSGRNLTWFLTGEEAPEITVVEPNPEAVDALLERLAALGARLPAERIHRCAIEEAPLPDAAFDLVICNAVLHFAKDDAHFDAMLRAAWRRVAPGGVFFARLATSIGIEGSIQALGSGWYRLPDESDRYLLDQERLLALTHQMGGVLLDPIKTTIVQGLRSMSTWVVQRPVA